MNAIDGSCEKTTRRKDGDGNPSTVSLTKSKQERNREVTRAHATELIDIYGSGALKLGLDAVVDHLLRGQAFPVDSKLLQGDTKINGASAYQVMKYIRILGEEDRQKKQAEEKLSFKEVRRVEEDRRRQEKADLKEARRLKHEKLVKDQADRKTAERVEMNKRAAERIQQEEVCRGEKEKPASMNGAVVKDLTPNYRLQDTVGTQSIDWSTQAPRLSPMDTSAVDLAATTGLKETKFDSKLTEYHGALQSLDLSKILPAGPLVKGSFFHIIQNLNFAKLDSVEAKSSHIAIGSSALRTPVPLQTAMKISAPGKGSSAMSPVLSLSAQSTTELGNFLPEITVDSAPTTATQVDRTGKSRGRLKETDINLKTGKLFTKEEWAFYQQVLASKPRNRGGRRGTTAKRRALERALTEAKKRSAEHIRADTQATGGGETTGSLASTLQDESKRSRKEKEALKRAPTSFTADMSEPHILAAVSDDKDQTWTGIQDTIATTKVLKQTQSQQQINAHGCSDWGRNPFKLLPICFPG
ncbi:hypothetical protein DL98DRAFT_538167 [Cadophora sp. DSE1049]|nr:hypothetical protein DL98DRAFT_538167 [Cadophora sp. DSE1049]